MRHDKEKETAFEGASSNMEAEAATRMAKRLLFGHVDIEVLITDKDGKIKAAFEQFFPGVQVIHCSSHMVKNLGAKIRAADLRLGKKKYSLSSKYAFLQTYYSCLFTHS